MNTHQPHRRAKGHRCCVGGSRFGALLVAGAVYAVSLQGHTQTITVDSDFQNYVYVAALTNSPPPSWTQTLAVALLSGYLTNAPYGVHYTNAPTDGLHYLADSVLGHPVGTVGAADFDFGEEIVPPADIAHFVDTNRPPGIEPAGNAHYVAEKGTLYASCPGYVDITWRGPSGENVGKVRYLISSLPDPKKPSVVLYHTHNADHNLTTNSPVKRAPVVSLGSLEARFLFNSVIPDNPADPYVYITAGVPQSVYAKARTGLLLLELRQGAQFVGLEIVVVRNNENAVVINADIGTRITPPPVQNIAKPRVTVGGLDSKIAEKNDYVYQHGRPGPQFGDIFPIKQTLSGDDIEVYWMRIGTGGVEWPYDLRKYKADWPTDSRKIQLYVRGTTQLGPAVKIPFPAELQAYQSEPGHATAVAGGQFSTTRPGLSLLKYEPSQDAVSFQVVRSVWNTTLYGPLQSQPIGEEITSSAHEIEDPGYIYRPAGDRYDWETYEGAEDNPPGWKAEWTTGQIIPVNEGQLEVWWYNLNQGVAWPSVVGRYTNQWLNVDDRIVIASQQGTGVMDPALYRNFRLYFQNSETNVGFNPNDEHALIAGLGAGRAIFALRDDLGSSRTSKPYVLMKYQDVEGSWRMRIYRVTAQEDPYYFRYPGRAGNLLQPPYPLQEFCKSQNQGKSGPFMKDRKGNFWAIAAGPARFTTSEIVMHWYYSADAAFYFPEEPHQRPAVCVPWLDQSLGTPIDVTYVIHWPDSIPEELVDALGPGSEVPALQVGETLIDPKRGLPAIDGQCNVQIWHQTSPGSVVLIDPVTTRWVGLNSVPGDVPNESIGGKIVFSKLPPHLRERLTYNPSKLRLEFKGVVKRPAAGQPYLLPNIITERERAILKKPEIMGIDPIFQSALSALANEAAAPQYVAPNSSSFESLALTAGFASGEGYVTLAFGNDSSLCGEASPISVQIVKVTCPLYPGSIRVVKSDSPFDEMLTLRFDGDLAGQSDHYQFQWAWRADEDGRQPTAPAPNDEPDPNWNYNYPLEPATGVGANDVTIAGPGRWTLSDNWFTCRYKPVPGGNASCGTNSWSEWTDPQLAEGWIKRVIAGINQFDQKFKDIGDPTKRLNMLISMISSAGERYEGNIPLSVANIDNYGLIEIYETILQRGISFSIEGNPPVDDPAVNKSLLLAASRLADLYMLLGNEAFADAADPTVGISSDPDLAYGGAPSSIHAFMGQTASLLEEELNLLRGRDDHQAPGVEIRPCYNRMEWNFALNSDGEVAYVLNYDIQDEQGAIDGQLTEEDAAVLYPQGHGDAWGHYLTAIKEYYRLLRHPNYTWVPQSEAVLIGGVPVTVDFFDERKFARAAVAKAKTGAEIVNLTYRSRFSEDPAQQWRGYPDDYLSRRSSRISEKEPRAWGVSEWGSRAGQGVFLDWAVGNAILPEEYADNYRITNDLRALGAQNTYNLSAAVTVGSPILSQRNFVGLPSFARELLNGTNGVSRYLASRLPGGVLQMLNNYLVTGTNEAVVKTTLASELNAVVGGLSIYDSARFHGVQLSANAQALLQYELAGDARAYLNRLLLQAAFPQWITGISQGGTIANAAGEMSPTAIAQLLAMPIRQFTGRRAFQNALDANVTVWEPLDRKAYSGIVLKYAQTGGIPEDLLAAFEVLEGNHYSTEQSLVQALIASSSSNQVQRYYQTELKPFVQMPSAEIPEGIQRIDRTTVTELRELGSALDNIQVEVDKADVGLNPLGLVRDMIPFDIDPLKVDDHISHFEQIYDRAVVSLNNAVAVFNRANGTTQAMRRQKDQEGEFTKTVRDQEADFKTRMIELFGYPYFEDVGGSGTYPDNYDGPDIYHYMYVDPSELIGEQPGPVLQMRVDFAELAVDGTTGDLTQRIVPVTYHLSQNGFGAVKPSGWTIRKAPGKIQMAQGELIQAKARFSKALLEYNNLIEQIQTQAELLEAQYALNANEIGIQQSGLAANKDLNGAIRKARERSLDFQTKGRIATLVANSVADMLPLSAGLSFDATAPIRGAIRLTGSIVTEVFTQDANRESMKELDHQQAKEIAQAVSNIELTTLRNEYAIKQQVAQLTQLVRSEAGLRLEIYSLQETMQQASSGFASTLASGERLMDEFLRFRQNTAARVQQNRYKDMAFRIFRNDALQKYRAQFDLAAAYVYMAAQAYDYETTLLKGDASGAALAFMDDIIHTRAIGTIGQNGPETGGAGDPGLADPMARLNKNWGTLDGTFNNPQNEENRFSLRREHFRILGKNIADADRKWENELADHWVEELTALPEFKRYASWPFQTAGPGLVIDFDTMVTPGLNFFGQVLGGGDSYYSFTHFATKIRGVGVWFSNYDTTGLPETPRIYLLPVGMDTLRSATDGETTLQWRIIDQTIPRPFPFDSSGVNNTIWVPMHAMQGGSFFTDVRKYGDFKAYHDSGSFDPTQVEKKDSRLIGRSVWNERWLLVIPAVNLGGPEGLRQFVHGRKRPDGTYDGNGVKDILLLFQTYAYAGTD